MAEDFAKQAAEQMPGILGPDTLVLKALYQLAEDGVNAVADATEEGASLRPRMADGGDEGRLPRCHIGAQLLFKGGVPEASVTHQNAVRPFHQARGYLRLTDIGWHYSEVGAGLRPAPTARPAEAHMHPESRRRSAWPQGLYQMPLHL